LLASAGDIFLSLEKNIDEMDGEDDDADAGVIVVKDGGDDVVDVG